MSTHYDLVRRCTKASIQAADFIAYRPDLYEEPFFMLAKDFRGYGTEQFIDWSERIALAVNQNDRNPAFSNLLSKTFKHFDRLLRENRDHWIGVCKRIEIYLRLEKIDERQTVFESKANRSPESTGR